MTAHLLIPALDLKNPVTFSSKIVQEILQKEIGFQGLIITDALNMKALSRYYMPEDTAINAYLAGHDLLLYGDHINPNIDKILKEDVPKAIENMKKAFQEHKLDEDTLNKKVSKIMNAKEELGLFKNRMVAESGIKNLCSSEALRLNQKLFDEAITMVRNEQNLLPLLLSKKTACLKLGSDEQDIFNTSYTTFTEKNVKNLLSSLNTFNNVIICLTTNIKKPPFTIPQETMQLLEEINKKTPTIIIVFDTPYLLKDLTNFQTVIMAYENDQCAKISAFKLLFNKTNVAKGVLPINITKN
jgi:beta-glucosidase-like glycosyl hydrolase